MSSGYAMINKEIRKYLTILTLYEQQKYMYDNKTHSVEQRIVSIEQPWLRLIVRGKAKAKAKAKEDQKQEYQDNTDRIEVERSFSLSKCCYGMGCITTKLEQTQLTSIALSIFVTNLLKIQKRIFYTLLQLFQIWYSQDVCDNWHLQISA